MYTRYLNPISIRRYLYGYFCSLFDGIFYPHFLHIKENPLPAISAVKTSLSPEK